MVTRTVAYRPPRVVSAGSRPDVQDVTRELQPSGHMSLAASTGIANISTPKPAPGKLVLRAITSVDYEDIGDNYALSQLSRGHCRNARINLGPLWGGNVP